MSKPIHPIRKILRDLDLPNSAEAPAEDRDIYQRALVRHVKPLLDALEVMHSMARQTYNHAEECDVCRLLVAWRAKL